MNDNVTKLEPSRDNKIRFLIELSHVNRDRVQSSEFEDILARQIELIHPLIVAGHKGGTISDRSGFSGYWEITT